MTQASPDLPTTSSQAVRDALRAKHEIALLDVREEHPFAQEHPLFAAQLSPSRLELDAPWRLPRREVPIVVYDDGEGQAQPAARRLQALGYSQVSLLHDGLNGWRNSGGEVFRDVNVPSKAFGELVEHERHTPSLSAEEVQALLAAKANVVVLDARRYDEYHTMNIPGSTSVPGAELALRVRALAPDPSTRVIVNCAGRTRSLIGTQSLVNAGIPNPVSALRNGTIGWTLAGFELERGQARRFNPDVSPDTLANAQATARKLALSAGAQAWPWDAPATQTALTTTGNRTVYRYDVRTPEEFAAGHLNNFGSAPGGQLVQETDVFAPVRGALILLADDDGVRAPMTAHWLAQMGWDVAWLTDVPATAFNNIDSWPPGPPSAAATIKPGGPPLNRYRRPYEGTDNPREAMQAYLDWEYGLVAQLARDATHGFKVLDTTLQNA